MKQLVAETEANNRHDRICVIVGSRQLFFGTGRFLIGSSKLAHIKIEDKREYICASLHVQETMVELKVISDFPECRADGRLLTTGDTVIVADELDLNIGNHICSIHVDQDLVQNVTVLEPRSGDLVTTKNIIIAELMRVLELRQIKIENLNKPEVKHRIELIVKSLLATKFANTQSQQLEKQILSEILGLGPLEELLHDSTISEIMVNRCDQIFIEKNGKLQLSNAKFSSDETLISVIERIVSATGRRIDVSSPLVDSRLSDGSRVNAIIPPLAVRGPCLTIRRFSKRRIDMDQLIAWGSVNAKLADLLKIIISQRTNLIVSGGTGSGKTTLLNVLSSFIPNEERIVTIEDAAELQLAQEHLVSLEARPANLEGKGAISIRDLVKNALRMRPDRIIVGECRGGEALDMLQAMNTGHDGSMTTAHANTCQDLLSRVETMVLMAGMDLPLQAIKQQVASAVDIILQQSRRADGSRGVTEMVWLPGIENGVYASQKLYEKKRDGEEFFYIDRLRNFFEQDRFHSVRGLANTAIDSIESLYGKNDQDECLNWNGANL